MAYKTVRYIFEWLAMLMLVGGVVTAALDVTLGGFRPVIWFLIAILSILIVICTEVSQIRESTQGQK